MNNPFASTTPQQDSASQSQAHYRSHGWENVAFLLLGTILMALFLQATAISQLADGLLQPMDVIEADYGMEPQGTRVMVAGSWLYVIPGVFYFVNLCGCAICAVICLVRSWVAALVMATNVVLCIAGIGLSLYFLMEVFVGQHL